MTKKYWFKPKTYGWGWQPSTKEGWLSTALYLFAVIAPVIYVKYSYEDPTLIKVLVFLFGWIGLCTISFLYLAYKKGPRPSWHWGNENHRK